MNDWLDLAGFTNGFETLKWLFKLAFSPHNDISRLIIIIILTVTAAIIVWSLLQGMILFVAYLKFWRLKRLLSHDPGKTWTVEEVDNLGLRRSAGRWMSRKVALVRSLREDVNAALIAVNSTDSAIAWRVHGILRFPISTLIIFGLLGTVWGLQASVYHLLPTMYGELDLADLKRVMVGTLSGMQTAFSTTLAGLICSLVAGVLVLVILKSLLGRFLQAQNRLLTNKIVPAYSMLGTDRLTTLVEQNKELKRTVVDIVEQSQVLFQPIVDSAAGLKSSLDQFYSAAHTMAEVGGNLKELGGSIEGGLDRLGISLAQVNTTLESFGAAQGRIEESVQKFNDLPGYFEGLLKSLAKSFAEAQEAQAQSQQQVVGQQLTQLKTVVEDLRNLANLQHDEESNLVNKLIGVSSNTMDRMEGGMSRLVEQLSKTADRVDEVNTTVLGSVERMGNNRELVGEAYLVAFKEQMGQVERGLSALIDQARRDEGNRNKQLVDAITEWVSYNQFLAKMLSNLEDLPLRLGHQIAEQQNAVAERLSTLPNMISQSLASTLADSTPKAVEDAGQYKA